MDSEDESEVRRISIEVNSDEMPEILTIVPEAAIGRESHDGKVLVSQRSLRGLESEISNNSEEFSKVLIEKEQEKFVNESLRKEYMTKLKVLEESNLNYVSEIEKLRKEMSLLKELTEEVKNKQEALEAAQTRIKELEETIGENENQISSLKSENKALKISKKDPADEKSKMEGLTKEDPAEEIKNLLKKVADLDSKYNDCVKDIDELKTELVNFKLKYAQSETEKGELSQKLMEKSKYKPF